MTARSASLVSSPLPPIVRVRTAPPCSQSCTVLVLEAMMSSQ